MHDSQLPAQLRRITPSRSGLKRSCNAIQQAVRWLTCLSAILLLNVLFTHAQDQSTPILQGYITRWASPTDFDVNGLRILCGPNTDWLAVKSRTGTLGSPLKTYFGEYMQIYGVETRKQRQIEASQIVAGISPGPLEGRGIIASVLFGNGTGQILLADGYRMLLTSHTQFKPPLKSPSGIAPNMWISYKGTLRADGVLVLSVAGIAPNVLSKGERRMEKKSGKEVPVSAAAKTHSSKSWLYPDSAMQSRVEKIGNLLIPSFERSLSSGDPSRIHFRFEVVDMKKWNKSTPLPNGVIPVPYQEVQRMQNDSQLAALLAVDISGEIDHHAWNEQKEARTMGAATGAVMLADPALVPIVAIWGADRHEKNKLIAAEDDQNARVALWLMHRAGYDIYQAPLAFWLIASKKPEPIANIPIPLQTEDFYKELGLLWRNSPQTAAARKAALPAA
jgi:hypothetical protein